MTVYITSILNHANASLLNYSNMVRIISMLTLHFALKEKIAKLICCPSLLLHELILSAFSHKSQNSQSLWVCQGNLVPFYQAPWPSVHKKGDCHIVRQPSTIKPNTGYG
ncbi:hypothetical protein DM15PD_13590 [Aristophania vespae]|nr:hypothetical protein DM15PD_13590 [Aristophania vespae]